MGAGGSVATLQSIKPQLEKFPESCDAAKAQELLGSNFDQKIFDQLKTNENVERSKLIAYYENLYKSAIAGTTSPATTADATAAPVATASIIYVDATAADATAIPVATVYVDATAAAADSGAAEMSASSSASKYAPGTTAVDYKTLHSIVRWNKPAKMDELKRLLATDAGAVHARDPNNGNFPLHIAAQNDFQDLCKLLLKAKHDPNKQNDAGQTPLHMAVSYCSPKLPKFLVSSGADATIKNKEGIPAGLGLEGLALINSAESAEDLGKWFSEIKTYFESIETGKFVKAVLAKKKALKASEDNWWNKDLDTQFRSVMQSS